MLTRVYKATGHEVHEGDCKMIAHFRKQNIFEYFKIVIRHQKKLGNFSIMWIDIFIA